MRRRLPAPLTAALVLALALMGCSSDDATVAGEDAAAPATAAPASAGPSSSGPEAPAGTSPTTADPDAAGEPGDPARASTGPTGAAAGTGPVTGGGSAAAPAPAAPATSTGQATAPGSYTYDSSGTVTAGTPRQVDGTATLTVDAPAGGQQHSVLETDQGRTETDAVLRRDGRYLARLLITNPAFTKELRAAPPVLLLPLPATVGRSWSWTATSTDGKTTAEADNTVQKQETVTIGGEQVACVVVRTALVLSGDIDYRGTTTSWVSTKYALSVQDHTQGQGTVSGFAFSTDLTDVLRSTRPA